MSFFHKGYNHVNEYIAFFFRNCMLGLHSYMSKNIYSIMNRVGIDFNDFLYKPLSWLKNKCKLSVTENWQINFIKELLLCRDGILDCPLTLEEINEQLYYLCIE